MKRKVISIFLSITVAVAFVPSFAFAANTTDDAQQLSGPETVSDGVSPLDDTDNSGDTGNTDFSKNKDENTPEAAEPAPDNPAKKNGNSQIRNLNEGDDSEISYNIEDYTFKLSKTSFFDNGKPQKPNVICSELEEGTDYIVEYEIDWYDEPIDPGTYYVYIYGTGEYAGNIELPYTIITTSITLNKTSATLYRNGTLQLKATVNNPNGKTTYSSSNTKVATVTSTGIVTAKAKGTATITVKNGSAKATATITVKNPSLNMSKATLYLNGSKTLKITGKIGKATFNSSNKKVATVNSSGKITAKKKGTCTITVKANGVTLKCKVTVKNPALSKSKLIVHNSSKGTLTVNGGKGKIKWKSSNKKIATVSSNGKVTGKKAGTCTITAKRGKFTMKCKVVVPKSYADYPNIPDFGAISGKTAKYKTSEDGAYGAVYKVKKSFSNKYLKLLKKKGFSYYTSSKGVKIYINANYDFVAVVYKKGFLAVIYANLWDSLE